MMLGVFDLAAQLRRHGLHAVADPQHRYPQFEHHGWRDGCFGGSHGFRATGKNYRLGSKLADFGLVQVPAIEFTINPCFAHAAGDQLGILGAKIEDQDAISVDIRGHEVSL